MVKKNNALQPPAAQELHKPRAVRGFNSETRRKSKLDLPEKLAKWIDSKNMIPRWVNAKELIGNDGFHHNEWQAFKIEDRGLLDGITWETGTDTASYLRRGDLILTWRPKGLDEEYKKELKNVIFVIKIYL